MPLFSLLALISAPIACIVLQALSSGYYLSFVSLYLADQGYSDQVLGWVHSCYYAGLLFGAWKADSTILRVGHIRAFAAFCGIGTACIILQAMTPNIWIWALTRMIMGFCLAVYYVVIESWFLGQSSDDTRGTVLSIYMSALYLGQACSQQILKLIDIHSIEAFLIAALLGVLSQVPLTLTSAPAPHIHEGSRHNLFSLWRRSRFGFSGCLISGILLSVIYSFLPLFAEDLGFSVASSMSCCILGGVVLQWPIGRLSDIADRRSVLLGLSVATVVSATGLALFTSSEWSFYLQVFILGGLLFTLYPLSITQVCDRLDIQDITKATGVLLLAYGAGAIIGPIAAPPFTQLFPVYGLPGFIAAVATFLSIIGAFMIWRQEGVPMEDQQDFVPLPVTTTPIGYDLDPRAPEIDEETEESATQQ